MKKYTILFLVLLLVIPVITRAESGSLDAPIKLRDGYYVAVAAGYDVYKMKDNIAYKDQDNIELFTMNPEIAVNGMIGNFILGYGKLWGKNSNLYLGMEFFANGSAADSDFEINIPSIPVIIDTDLIVNGSFGLGLISGFKINPTSMVYLKLGYNWSTLSVDETFRTQHDYEFNSIEYHDEITIDGFSYGVGLESAFNEQFSMRTEYSHTTYGSFYTGSGSMIKPSRNQFLLGLVYRFAS